MACKEATKGNFPATVLWSIIISYNSEKEPQLLCRISLVCKKWRALVEKGPFWKDLFHRFTRAERDLLSISKSSNNWRLLACRLFQNRMEFVDSHLGQLRHIPKNLLEVSSLERYCLTKKDATLLLEMLIGKDSPLITLTLLSYKPSFDAPYIFSRLHAGWLKKTHDARNPYLFPLELIVRSHVDLTSFFLSHDFLKTFQLILALSIYRSVPLSAWIACGLDPNVRMQETDLSLLHLVILCIDQHPPLYQRALTQREMQEKQLHAHDRPDPLKFLLERHDLAFTPDPLTSETFEQEFSKLISMPNSALDAQDFLGYTPLHLAQLIGLKRIAKQLIEAGARTDIQNFEGKTPKELRESKVSTQVDLFYSNFLLRTFQR